MQELTLEGLAKRVEALEKKLAEQAAPGKVDRLKVVGISEGNEFTRPMRAEIEANREAERQAARAEADGAIIRDESPAGSNIPSRLPPLVPAASEWDVATRLIDSD